MKKKIALLLGLVLVTSIGVRLHSAHATDASTKSPRVSRTGKVGTNYNPMIPTDVGWRVFECQGSGGCVVSDEAGNLPVNGVAGVLHEVCASSTTFSSTGSFQIFDSTSATVMYLNAGGALTGSSGTTVISSTFTLALGTFNNRALTPQISTTTLQGGVLGLCTSPLDVQYNTGLVELSNNANSDVFILYSVNGGPK